MTHTFWCQIRWRHCRRCTCLNKEYRGFPSRKAYEAHYSNIDNYRDELSAMEEYTKEAEAERKAGIK